jgi:hypothetical protein
LTEDELKAGVATVFASATPALATEAEPILMDHPATISVDAFEYDLNLNAVVVQLVCGYEDETEVLDYAWSVTRGVSGFYVALISQDPDAAEPYIPYFPEFDLTVNGTRYFVDSDTMIGIGLDEIDQSEWHDALNKNPIDTGGPDTATL